MERVACVDYSVAKGGAWSPTACFDGETVLSTDKFVAV